MRSFRWAPQFGLSLLLLTLLPLETMGQTIVVTPLCGTSDTHFQLSASGWPIPADCDSCQTSLSLYAGTPPSPIYSKLSNFGECLNSISVDLHDLPNCPSCGCCGQITYKLVVTTICQTTPSYEYNSCVQTTISTSLATAVGDPWALTQSVPPKNAAAGTDTAAVLLRFIPSSTCGFPPCDEVHLIQVVQATGYYHNGSFRHLTDTEQMMAGADSLDAWTTTDLRHIDIAPRIRSPYLTISNYGSQNKRGKVGTPPDTAQFFDAPKRGDSAYPDSVYRIVLDFEVNAFCASGPGRGQYLGSSVWQWERIKGALNPLGKITLQPQGTLNQPTGPFRAAVNRWAQRRRFPLPTPPSQPKQGGGPCP